MIAAIDPGIMRKEAEKRRADAEAVVLDRGLTVLFMDGLDYAIIGIGSGPGLPEPIVCYDPKRIIEWLTVVDGMTEEDAWDHYGFNIESAYTGELSPMFIEPLGAFP